MSGSKKGRKLGPYRTGATVRVHVLLRTAEEAAGDAWEYGATPPTREMLDEIVDFGVA
jgi:hypothetical protein